MLKLEELLNEIENYELVKRFKELDAILSSSRYFNDSMNKMKKLQREIVQKQNSNLDSISLEIEYNDLMTELVENPIIAEYLDIKEQLNNLLADIQKIFSAKPQEE